MELTSLEVNQPHPTPYEVEWSILAHSKPFDPVTGVCRLWLLEAYFIKSLTQKTAH